MSEVEGLLFEQTDAYVAEVAGYVIKSGAPTTIEGIAPQSLEVAAGGPVLNGLPDRWAVAAAVTDRDNHAADMISGRGWGPGKQSIDYPGDSMLLLARNDVDSEGMLTVTLPNGSKFSVSPDDAERGEPWAVKIHSSTYIARDLGPLAVEALSDYLDVANSSDPERARREVRLFGASLLSHPRGPGRNVRSEYQRPGVSTTLYGADGAALLATNAATLRYIQAASERSDADLGMDRTRPNIVIEGLDPQVERSIAAMRIGDLVLVNVGSSGRCVLTGADPKSGDRDNNRFLKALGKAGQGGKSVATGEPGLFFGINLQPVLGPGQHATIDTNMPVEIAWAEQPNVV